MHVLIVGNSFSGKSWLAKAFAQRNERVLVFDPTMSRGWPSDAIKWADPYAFLDEIEQASAAHVYIDEAATLWDADEARADALVYRGRHRGLLLTLIAQRTRMIRPNARNQCSRIYAFRQQLDDAKTLAAEYHASLLECVELPARVCIATDGFQSSRLSLDFATLPPLVVPEDDTESAALAS